jgi:predicted AAA+ superfamily ATPase
MFRGRIQEIQTLRAANWRDTGELIVVYGRRRVGKTALIEHTFKDLPLWKFEGIEGEGLKIQLVTAIQSLNHYTKKEYNLRECPSWQEFFNILKAELELRKDHPPVLFFDEFQWTAEMGNTFVAVFKSFWDNTLSRYKNLKVILCGSISSFMVKKVLRSKALYGRITQEIHLLPLSLAEIKSFFGTKRKAKEILEIAMCFGGIPKYLEELNPQLSLTQNLHELAFTRNGYFFREYERIFLSHFGGNRHYETIVKALSVKSLSAEELAKKCKLQTGGTFSERLEELQLAGFIERFTPIYQDSVKSKAIRYRLIDEYLLLYFSLIAPFKKEIEGGTIEASQILTNRSFQQWRGYAFERLCMRNSNLLADTLRFSGIRYKVGSWFSTRKESLSGIQIDLLFERADDMLTICEMKYSPILNAAKISDNFQTKLQALANHYPRHGIQKVLVLGLKISVPSRVLQDFDRVLFAEEVFL